MSKLSIRPRTLDACKFIPIYKCEDIPDLNDYASINRSIPQLPTGMEKEEESEHHLQQAISAQQTKGTTGELVIPTPEVYNAPEAFFNELYAVSYKLPRQLIHVQPFAIEHDIPDYDMDSEDELWLEKQKEQLDNLTPLKFEEIMDRLEKSSSQHVISIKEAKMLLKEDEDVIIAVFDYWLNKRLRTQMPLIPQVRTERRDMAPGNSSNNPYIAFRRRTEKMQTRKNRKNDEISYEKMLKLRRDLSRAKDLLALVRQREKTKIEHLKSTMEIFEKRYQISDFNGNVLNELIAQRQARPPSVYIPLSSVLKANENKPPRKDEAAKKKREYKKRHRTEAKQVEASDLHEYGYSSEDEDATGSASQTLSDQEEENPDGAFAFKRKKGCLYHAPISDPFGNWPFYSAEERARANDKYNFYLTEIRPDNPKYIGLLRRRVGRGGRIVFDRTPIRADTLSESDLSAPHYRPKEPLRNAPESVVEEEEEISNSKLYDEFGNYVPAVPINLNDYLFVKNEPLTTEVGTGSDIDLMRFKNHQEELLEMRKEQLEVLKKGPVNTNRSSADIAEVEPTSEKQKASEEASIDGLQNLSLDQIDNSCTRVSVVSMVRRDQSVSCNKSIASTLDRESVQFAVSALLSSGNAQPSGQNVPSSGPAIAATAVTNTTPQGMGSSLVDSFDSLVAVSGTSNGPTNHHEAFESGSPGSPSKARKQIKFSSPTSQNSLPSVESNLTSTDVT